LQEKVPKESGEVWEGGEVWEVSKVMEVWEAEAICQ
jgi:hypothetical protein